jgi:hypothetical protein
VPLDSGLQIILQYPTLGGEGQCLGYAPAPVDAPTYIAVVPVTPTCVAQAEQLGRAIERDLAWLTSTLQRRPTPCGGSGFPGKCHALNVPECRKVIVPVLDSRVGPSYAFPAEWRSAANVTVVPVVVPPASASILAGGPLANTNALTWSPRDPLMAGRVLDAADIGARRRRVFISYVRRESSALAEQLFDRLQRERFSVFLDSFTLEPGIDFEERLQEELADKGTVLVLETRSNGHRTWTRFEVDFARRHRLGLLALRLPKGRAVAGIDQGRRRAVSSLDRRGRASPAAMDALVAWLVLASSRAEEHRRAYLRNALADALSLHGVQRLSFVAPDVLIAQDTRGQPFSVRVSSLPAELSDFHYAGRHRPPAIDAYVVAPGQFVRWRRRDPIEWLTQQTRVQLYDEGEIDALAQDVA